MRSRNWPWFKKERKRTPYTVADQLREREEAQERADRDWGNLFPTWWSGMGGKESSLFLSYMKFSENLMMMPPTMPYPREMHFKKGGVHLPLDTLREHLAKVKYRPGTMFSLSPTMHPHAGADPKDLDPCVHLTITLRCMDSYDHTRTIPISLSRCYNLHTVRIYAQDVGQFLESIRGALHELEKHESDEFLVYNGVRPFDPHRIFDL